MAALCTTKPLERNEKFIDDITKECSIEDDCEGQCDSINISFAKS